VSLRLVRSFGHVTRQSGRALDRRRFGVPPGGAFDREALALANALVGQDPASEGWELALASADFEAQSDGWLAVVGGDGGSAIRLDAGQVFAVPVPALGARTYVAWGHVRAAGSVRHLAEPPSSSRVTPIAVVSGPQAEAFDVSRLLGAEWRVSHASDRVGIRLDGAGPAHALELPSEPACPGAIQVTPSGQPIVLGPDGPTIGGYPKPLVVASVDLNRLGQLRPGVAVTFELISLEEARERARMAAEDLARRVWEIRLATQG